MPDTPTPFSFPTPEPQVGAAEILEAGSGHTPLRPERERNPRTRRRLLLGGVGLLGVGAVTAAAFGAWWYTTTGPQPAEALPATVLGYAAIDLDPAGKQKLAALDVLTKLPSVDDGLDLGGNPASVDVTEGLLKAVLDDADCDEVSAEDVTAWLGDRAAVAAVPGVDGEMPDPIVVLQVSDGDAARDGLDELAACGDLDELGDDLGIDVDGEWAVVAETQEIVDRVVADRAEGTLAEDDDFLTWTEAAGDPGVVALYAAPSAGDWMAELLEQDEFAAAFTAQNSMQACPYPEEAILPESQLSRREMNKIYREWDACRQQAETTPSPEGTAALRQMQDEMRSFVGFAATLRFEDGGVEAEIVSDAAWSSTGTFVGGTGAGDALRELPASTAIAGSFSVKDDWFQELVDYLGPTYAAMGIDLEMIYDEIERGTGLELPEDMGVLDGRTLAVALPDDFETDISSLEDVRVGLTVDGDPEPVSALVAQIRRTLSEMSGVDASGVEDRAGDDLLVIGPNGDWNDALLDGGGLGGTDGFDDVLPEIEDANAALFVDVAAVLDWIDREDLSAEDRELVRNVEAFELAGVSSWEADDLAHGLVRITTGD